MSSTTRLSCLEITGPLDENTPLCVLREVARVHRVNANIRSGLEGGNRFVILDIIRELTEAANSQPLITLPLTEQSDCAAVAHFINPYVEWPEGELRDALRTAMIYMRDAPLPGRNFNYGYPIPSDTTRLGVCVLYKICRINDLPVRFDHTIDNLAAAVRMIVQNIDLSRSQMRGCISRVREESLPVLYLTACEMMDVEEIEDAQQATLPLQSQEGSCGEEDDEDAEVTIDDVYDYHEDITHSVETFKSKEKMLRRINPRTPGEAIALAALNFGVDISTSVQVVPEYLNLRNYLVAERDWVPIDPTMQTLIKFNPLSFQLDSFFNPRLPYELYVEDELAQLAVEEGYTLEDLRRESAYSLLSTAFLSHTFYHGRLPTIINDQTPIGWDPVDEVPDDCIICFGVRTLGVTAFRYSELADDFSQKKNFTNPLNREGMAFPSLAIKKLKRLCQKIQVGETPEGSAERQKLLHTITLTELFTNEHNVRARELYLVYSNGDSELQASVSAAVNALLHLSMCCRGWLSDEAPYPIENAPVDNQYEVDVRVTQSIAAFEICCGECGAEVSEMILGLPLLRFRGDWQICDNAGEGTTIGERLTILKNGEDHGNYNSCMRLTSNYFAASAWRYLEVLGFPPPFDITRLRDIS